MAGRRILITGVASHLGTRIAERLAADPDFSYVAGMDSRPPPRRVKGLDYIEADIRRPSIMRVLPETKVDTLVHNNILRQPRAGMSSQAAHDINVIGSLQLLAACERITTLRSIVVRGSAGIYGSEPAAPQFFTEEMASLYPLRTRFQRDVGEIEAYFATYANRHPGVTCTMLRYQPAVGKALATQLTRYLSLPVAPTYLGFDPRVQVVHEYDAVEAMVAAVKNPVRGAVNVAGPGTIGLTRALRMGGRTTVPLPPQLFGAATGAVRRFGLMSFSPDFRALLRYGRAVDTRRLVEDVGYTPRYSTPQAFESYLLGRRPDDSGAETRPGERVRA